MSVHELAGKPVPREFLVNVPRLVAAYYAHRPDPADPAQRVSFGTSGHRGSSLKGSFNEGHVLAVSQALAEYRKREGRSGPLYVGMDTHALSEPAFVSALEVLAANDVEVRIQQGRGYTPTPVISHAILTFNRGRSSGQADGIVITPSHNPPGTGDSSTTRRRGGPRTAARRASSRNGPTRSLSAASGRSGAFPSIALSRRPRRRSTTT